ncbi:GNAT family N-acetyltransferase [Kitasatospora nipponensis]|uniref:GNAT family N-acetyltransferase n=1 Tax=Kitasatospora nipponensis TaxID=258049 RepID=A0ABP4HI07_9ACTN
MNGSQPPYTVRTERLELSPVGPEDLDALYEINADPGAWRHLPQGRHTGPAQTRDLIERAVAGWSEGIGYWTARRIEDGVVVGLGGVQAQRSRGHWNLFYRLGTAHWGRGYATELGRAALAAAHAHDPRLPVVAWIHAGNPGSQAVVRRLGMVDHGLRLDPFYRRLLYVYADREVPEQRAGSSAFAS